MVLSGNLLLCIRTKTSWYTVIDIAMLLSYTNMFLKCTFSGVHTYLHCEHVMHLVPGYGTAMPVRVAATALCCPRWHSAHGTHGLKLILSCSLYPPQCVYHTTIVHPMIMTEGIIWTIAHWAICSVAIYVSYYTFSGASFFFFFFLRTGVTLLTWLLR